MRVVKHLTGLDSRQKQFMDHMNQLTYSRSAWEIWRDFVTMSACAISNAVDRSPKREERERLYLDTAGRYKADELDKISGMLAATAAALDDDPEQDFLGDLFQMLELSSHWHGQFFTPYSVCTFMAEIGLGEKVKAEIEEKGHISVNDPACGAGALLIAAANACRAVKVNYQTSVEFIGQDIDFTAAMMCYIQISLLGCPGYVIVGDTLKHPPTDPMPEDYQVWYTPLWYSDIWQWRRLFHAVDRVMGDIPKRVSRERPAAPPEWFYFYYFTEEAARS